MDWPMGGRRAGPVLGRHEPAGRLYPLRQLLRGRAEDQGHYIRGL
jgi:hypothetical protein